MDFFRSCAVGDSLRKFWLLFAASLLGVIISSAIFLFPRISESPLPTDPVRFHIHVGDGSTEQGWVLPALTQWREKGALHSWGIPCIGSDATGRCNGYTHYPAAPFLLARLIDASIENWPETTRLKIARTFFSGITICLSAGALALLLSWLHLPVFTALIMGLILGALPGFVIYADNLFGHGITTSLQALGWLVISWPWLHHQAQPKRWPLLVGLIGFANALWSWEGLPTLFVAMLVTLLLSRAIAEPARKNLLRGAFFLTLGTGVAISLRFLQNSLFFGSFSEALLNWRSISETRVAGLQHFSWDYLVHARVSIGQMVGRFGLLALTATFLLLGFRDRVNFRRFTLAALSFGAWSLFMIQHSSHHAYTFRYSIWCLVIGLGLIGTLCWPRPLAVDGKKS